MTMLCFRIHGGSSTTIPSYIQNSKWLHRVVYHQQQFHSSIPTVTPSMAKSQYRHFSGKRTQWMEDKNKRNDDNQTNTSFLIQLENTTLSYPSSHDREEQLKDVCLTIRPPTEGGHALLGKNGVGKTLLTHAFTSESSQLTKKQRQQRSQEVADEYENNNNNNNNGSSNPFLVSGTIRLGDKEGVDRSQTNKWLFNSMVVYVSFESHQEVLNAMTIHGNQEDINDASQDSHQSHRPKPKPSQTAYQVITGGSGVLNKAAQFLIVRFGLYQFLHRDVDTLSTGEIRKVLLVRALAQKPKVLILDNAFDGLDVASRQILSEIVSKTLQGFTQDILVRGVSSSATAHTQVILITHRPEEIVNEIQTVSYFVDHSSTSTTTNNNNNNNDNNYQQSTARTLESTSRNGKSGMELLQNMIHRHGNTRTFLESNVSIKAENDATTTATTTAIRFPLPWENNSYRFPKDQVQEWWRSVERATTDSSLPLIHLEDFFVQRDQAHLLKNIHWSVLPGQRWVIAGGNGAGKSTLSRTLANAIRQRSSNNNSNSNTPSDKQEWDGILNVNATVSEHGIGGVGWVSTELHMSLSQPEQSSLSARQILLLQVQQQQQQQQQQARAQENEGIALKDDPIIRLAAEKMARSLLFSNEDWWSDDHDDKMQRLLDQPFVKLSQGQQKLIVIASAWACRPQLLVLDEPCQGLDWENRCNVLGLVEQICTIDPLLSVIYITHHWEEVFPSISHVLHLEKGQESYQGLISEYEPETIDKKSTK